MYFWLKKMWSRFIYWIYYKDDYFYYSDSDEWEEKDISERWEIETCNVPTNI